MKKCKDCLYFKNGCGFSDVDKELNLDGDFEACGHFKRKKITESEEAED
ncbi:MAG: hypothetical protein NC548_31245 [Lachnospiraceae bacterium]|nr:hypothetical protein [Bacteroides fragilis]MCM1218980.1 hypothetical protein [Lachnospiraceae bacterium]